MVQWVPHAATRDDAGLGLVTERTRVTNERSYAFKIRWHRDIYDGSPETGYWYVYPQDFDDIVVVA